MKISVIGGSYGEDCAFPKKEIYRGSGFRAAAVLSHQGVTVEFHSAVGDELGEIFRSLSTKLNIQSNFSHRKEDIWFRYRHPLGQARSYPNNPDKVHYDSAIETERAVVFGMLEGRPKVKAKKVVYDPQDGVNAKEFEFNGSSADEIAIVASYSEGVALTRKSSPREIAEQLLSKSSIEVVIIKCGAQGALISTRNDQGWIHPIPTLRVFKIGSGDIFTAVFAYFWLGEEKNAIESARFASSFTAKYVESGLDRFEIQARERSNFRLPAVSPESKLVPNSKIYIAGPFFNTAQQWLVDEVRGSLADLGFQPFSPIHDIGPGDPADVAPKDLFAIENSKVVLALLDSFDPGTLFEIGYARALDIRVIVVVESDVPEHYMTMIIGSGCEVVNDLATGIYMACWNVTGDV